MRRLLAACLLLLSLPLYGLPATASRCADAPLLQLAMEGDEADVPATDGLLPGVRTVAWAIVGESPRLLRDDLLPPASPVYSWLPPLRLERPQPPALPVAGQLRGHVARLRIGSVQQLL